MELWSGIGFAVGCFLSVIPCVLLSIAVYLHDVDPRGIEIAKPAHLVALGILLFPVVWGLMAVSVPERANQVTAFSAILAVGVSAFYAATKPMWDAIDESFM